MDKNNFKTTALDLLAKMYESIPEECQPLPRGVLQSKNALANLIQGVHQEQLPHEAETRTVNIGDTVYYLNSNSVCSGVVGKLITVQGYFWGKPLSINTKIQVWVLPQNYLELIGNEYMEEKELYDILPINRVFTTKQELLDSL